MVETVLFPIVSKINEYLSSYILIFLLVGVGLWYSIKTRFVQVRCFGEGMKKFFGEMNLRGGAQKSGMTSFQALATGLYATAAPLLASSESSGGVTNVACAQTVAGPSALRSSHPDQRSTGDARSTPSLPCQTRCGRP